VCKTFLEWIYSNEFWKPHCLRLKLIDPASEQVNCRGEYQIWFQKFGGCESTYLKMKGLYDRLLSWAKSVNIQFDLLSPVPLEDLVTAEAQLSRFYGRPFAFPDDLRCWYLMTAGQEIKRRTHGMLGGYSFYGDFVNLFCLPLKTVLSIMDVNHKLIPICASPQSQKAYYLVPFDGPVGTLPNTKRGNIVEESQVSKIEWEVSTSFGALLSSRLHGYETGIYPVTEKMISLFPSDTPVVTTNGVSIKAAPLFIPEKSSKATSNYFWAYSITMTMAKDVAPEYSCQLQSRHWDISPERGRQETVDGPGVIGEFPKMFPGAFFNYQSCCPLQTPSGQMGGSFKMVRRDGISFDAIVPTWRFCLPNIPSEF